MDLLATQLAAQVRAGELTARQATEAALDRIDATQPKFDAWQVIRRDAALAEADAVDARPDRTELPLAGAHLGRQLGCEEVHPRRLASLAQLSGSASRSP
jgi:Asp-tRNA(Asn)/Glu-tRNA(Gln) amidotransferase A subunit family amidase